jgi:hypothetical protein
MQVLLDRWRYELRLLGGLTFALPVGIGIIYLGFSLFARNNGSTPALATLDMGRGLLALLENGLPLGAGLIAAIAVAPDRSLELHLSVPARYRRTVLARLAVVVAWALLISGVACGMVIAGGEWVFPVAGWDRVLLWLPSLLCFAALGALFTLALRSRVASSTILGILWIVQFLLEPVFLQDDVLKRLYLFTSEEIFPGILQLPQSAWYDIWLQNRLILTGVALILFAGSALVLRNTEALLRVEE